MATSPRNELRIVAVTEFVRSPKDGLWYWTTKAANSEPVGDGAEGYKELRKAVNGFFAQQGMDLEAVEPDGNPYSKIVKVTNSEYHIRRYAHGAPDPFDVNDPRALAQRGWVPSVAHEDHR